MRWRPRVPTDSQRCFERACRTAQVGYPLNHRRSPHAGDRRLPSGTPPGLLTTNQRRFARWTTSLPLTGAVLGLSELLA